MNDEVEELKEDIGIKTEFMKLDELEEIRNFINKIIEEKKKNTCSQCHEDFEDCDCRYGLI